MFTAKQINRRSSGYHTPLEDVMNQGMTLGTCGGFHFFLLLMKKVHLFISLTTDWIPKHPIINLKWFPQLEDFSSQFTHMRYQVTLDLSSSHTCSSLYSFGALNCLFLRKLWLIKVSMCFHSKARHQHWQNHSVFGLVVFLSLWSPQTWPADQCTAGKRARLCCIRK